MSLSILVLSDSVPLPRKSPEYTNYNETWPNLLRQQGFNVIQWSMGGATIKEINRQTAYYNLDCCNIDYVIIQSGIVDCAPRFIGKYEQDILMKIPVLGNKIIKLLNKNWIRKVRNITYTSETRYETTINKIKQAYGDKVHFLSIIPAHKSYEEKLPGVTKKINTYNSILKNNAKVIDITGVENEGIMSDYHHLNKSGHLFISYKIMSALNLNSLAKEN